MNKMSEKIKLLEEVWRFLVKLVKEKFYGKVEITFEKGKVVHLRKMENIKLNSKKEEKEIK